MSDMDESVVSAFTVVGDWRMPSDSGIAFVAIVHLSQEHESNLAGILQACTSMPVTQVRETVKIEPDHVYVIPPSNHLAMIDGMIKLTEPEQIRCKRLPIDLFSRDAGGGST